MSKKRNHRQPRRRFLGTFGFGGRPVTGELTLKGPNTLLTLHDPSFLGRLAAGAYLHGTSYTGERLTLIDCRVSRTSHSGTPAEGVSRYQAEIFPHYVLVGGQIDPGQPCISAIKFTSTDLTTLFYDFDAFSQVIDPKPIIDTVLQERRRLRPVESGNMPLVCYFTGRQCLADLHTAIGRVSVHHAPRFNAGGPDGVYISNQIVVSLQPDAPVVFAEAMDRVYDLACFPSVAAGRSQGIDDIRITAAAGVSHKLVTLAVHPSYRQKAKRRVDSHAPHPSDVPLDPIRHPAEFGDVLKDWIRRHEGWRVARMRYLDCMRKGNVYNTERLVAAANMFDILPADSVPVPTGLPPDLAATKATCEELWRQHPAGIDRNSALSALGPLGKPSLPKKIAHRVAIFHTKLAARFPELQFVASVAVKCRNFFVHGSDEIDYPRLEHLVPFLTDTLEFVFAASDLIDAGWDAQRWDGLDPGWGHSFARFRLNYVMSLADLHRVTQ